MPHNSSREGEGMKIRCARVIILVAFSFENLLKTFSKICWVAATHGWLSAYWPLVGCFVLLDSLFKSCSCEVCCFESPLMSCSLIIDELCVYYFRILDQLGMWSCIRINYKMLNLRLLNRSVALKSNSGLKFPKK